MGSMSGMTTVVLVLLLAAVPAFSTDYTVGDGQGWTQSVDYSTWASDKTFNVGDSLVFQYSGLHTVDEVSKADYDGCSSSNTLKSYNDQNTKISLTAPGPRYFICGTAGHCVGGMKLAVTVASGSTTPTTPSTPSTPSTPTPSTPNTPSTPTPSTPNGGSPTPKPSAAAGLGANAMLVGGLLVGVALMV